MTDAPDSDPVAGTPDEDGAVARLRVLDRRTPAATGWSSGDVVRRTVVRRRRRRVLFGGTATAVVAATAITLGLTSGGAPAPVRVTPVAGIRVGARIDGAVQLVSDSTTPPPTTGPVAQVVRAQQSLAIELLRTIGTDGGRTNLSVSPYSLQLALGMLRNGARGTTERQIATALQSPGLTTRQLDAGLAALTGSLAAAAHGHFRLESANSLWTQQGLRLRARFLAAVTRYFRAGVWQTDFSTTQGLDAINHWTDTHTHGAIPKLFDALDPSTVLVLANALYLHADWQVPFDKDETKPGRFTTASGQPVTTQFMNGDEAVPGVSTATYDAAQLPYRGGRFAALVVMPTHESLSTFVDGLTPAGLSGIAASVRSGSARVDLPRFTTRTTTDLAPPLERLGMPKAFSSSADFSGLGVNGSIGQATQRVYLRVTEKGTTAAAATGLGAVLSSTAPAAIRFDHPFLFLVRDTTTGAVLFATEIDDPSAG